MIRPVVRSVVLGASLFVSSGCGASDESPGPKKSHAHDACADGELTLEDGSCQPAGPPADPCAPGETAVDGVCQAAGIAACGDGFQRSDDGACAAILPDAACPKGKIAIPGDTSCHEVAPCGDGWGSAPLDATTEYVDGDYAGGDSDGSSARPWTTLQAGIDAAENGAIVAIAAGSYAEDLAIEGKAVRLWGKCPALVAIAGAGAKQAVLVTSAAGGIELHDLAITGPATGLLVSGADVLVERVWVHGLPGAGIGAFDVKGPTRLEVRSSLIEATAQGGVLIGGAETLVEDSVVRGTSVGYGFEIHDVPAPGVTVRRSVVEHTAEYGVKATASQLTLDAVVVRETQPGSDGKDGGGVVAQDDLETGVRSSLTLTGSAIERNRNIAVAVVGSDATVEATVIRDTAARGDGLFGEGMFLQDGAKVEVTGSAVLRSREGGLVASGSALTLVGSVVRDVAMNDHGELGVGVGARPGTKTGARSTLLVRGSVVEQAHDVGIFVGGSDATIEQSVVRGTQTNDAGIYGRGILVQVDPPSGQRAIASLTGCLVEDNHETGIAVVASDATIEATLVRGTLANGTGHLGDGIALVSETGPASATIVGTRIESSARAALSSFGASVTFGANVFDCNGFDLEGEEFEGAAFAFDHTGGNVCGCADASAECRVQSAGLEAPTLGETGP